MYPLDAGPQLKRGGREVTGVEVSESALTPGLYTICLWHRTQGPDQGIFVAVGSPLVFHGPRHFELLLDGQSDGPRAFVPFDVQVCLNRQGLGLGCSGSWDVRGGEGVEGSAGASRSQCNNEDQLWWTRGVLKNPEFFFVHDSP